ncbi:MAG: hypothetical protein ACPGTQ_11745 [Colwellia sp.]|jgi:hypothetical protein
MGFEFQYIAFYLIFGFAGLFLGWFFRNGMSILGIIFLACVYPIIQVLSTINVLQFTLCFIAGFLIHTWKPIYHKLKSL